jgi:hypothetical protein
MKVVGIDCECVNLPKNHLIAVAMNSMHKCQNLKLLATWTLVCERIMEHSFG